MRRDCNEWLASARSEIKGLERVGPNGNARIRRTVRDGLDEGGTLTHHYPDRRQWRSTSMAMSLAFTPDAFPIGVLPAFAGTAIEPGQMATGSPPSPVTGSAFILIWLSGATLGQHRAKASIPLPQPMPSLLHAAPTTSSPWRSRTKICRALPGLTTGYGPSHQATEDLAIFRGLPNMTIIDPCDADDIMGMVPQIAAQDGPVYARLPRGRVPSVLTRHKPDYRFQLGKAQVIREGRDVLIISTGFMTMRALDAAERLAADHVDAAVLHVPTIKPFDTETILAEARKGGRLVVTAENHTIVGGLGEAVATTLLTTGVTPKFRMIGLPDEFLEADALPTLHEMYGLTVDKVAERIKGWL